jgi:diguanylate cyclase
MKSADLPENEVYRLASLKSLKVLDTENEGEFDAFVKAAAAVCGTPIALISLVDEHRQWFKANHGLTGVTETPRASAFCAHTILQEDTLTVEDAQQDSRFVDNPLVTSEPHIRFYAGAPVTLSNGSRVGTLCVIDRAPRQLDKSQAKVLQFLAHGVAQLFEKNRKASQDYLLPMETMPAMFHSIDPEGRLLTVSDEWLLRLGCRREDVIGKKSFEFFSKETQERISIDAKPRFFQTGSQKNVPAQMLTAFGGKIDVVLSSVLERDEHGIPIRAMTIIEDVTERNSALRMSSDLLAVARTQFILSVTDANGIFIEVNDLFCKISGYSEHELLGTHCRIVESDKQPLAYFKSLWRRLQRGQPWRGEICHRAKNGDEYWVDAVIAPLMGSNGKPERFVSLHSDITSKKIQEQALISSRELLARTGAAAGVGGWQLDLISGALYWSEQTYTIHGVAPTYKPALSEAISFYARDARPIIQAAVDRSMIDGSVWDLELPFIKARGESIWVRATGKAEIKDGVPVSLLGTFQDITSQVEQRQALEGLHQRLALATKGAGIGTWDYDILNDVLQWDSMMCELHGLEKSNHPVTASAWLSYMHQDDWVRTQATVKDAIKNGRSYDLEARIVRPDGSVRYVRSTAQVSSFQNGKTLRYVGVTWDVTETRLMALEIARQHDLLKVTLESITDAVLTTDESGKVAWLNPVAERLTGWTNAAAKGLALAQVFRLCSEESLPVKLLPIAVAVAQHCLTGTTEPVILLSRNAERYGIEQSAAPLLNHEGQLLGIVVIFRDVTEQRRLHKEVSHRASHDTLTGLVSRSEFEQRLNKIIDSLKTDGTEHTVLFLDLDQFKLVNDACGHSAGDQLLVQVAKLLGHTTRSSDTIARLGGDEFGIILENCSNDNAKRVADQICERMNDFRFAHSDRRFRIGVSIGMVPLDNRWTSTSSVMQAADSACYAAKDAGRNRVHVWFDTDQNMQIRQGDMKWASRLEQALDEDRFILYGQNIVAINTPSRGLYAEVLVRLRDVDGTLVPPGAFLPAAERFHLASRLDRWVLRKTISMLTCCADSSLIETLSVNLSGQSIGDQTFHREAHMLLIEAGPKICSKICLEITETAAITCIADASSFITHVQALGVRVSLDDFGSGASSFGYLKELKVDQIKIDGQFIKGLLNDSLDDVAVRSFVEVARVVNAQTVAEFIDHPDILERVREIGIHYGQGYLLHKPEPLIEILKAKEVSNVSTLM